MRKSFAPSLRWAHGSPPRRDSRSGGHRDAAVGQRREAARGEHEDLVVDISRMIEIASSASTLYPGDLIATGTPAGVGPLHAGDEVTIEVDDVGRMTIPSSQRRAVPTPCLRHRTIQARGGVRSLRHHVSFSQADHLRRFGTGDCDHSCVLGDQMLAEIIARTTPLHRYPLLGSGSVEPACNSVLPDSSGFELGGHPGEFTATGNFIRLNSIALAYLSYGAAARICCGAIDTVANSSASPAARRRGSVRTLSH